MNSKLRIAISITLVLALGSTSVAFAQEDRPEGTFRMAGEITHVASGGIFTLVNRHGTEMTFLTSDGTEYKGRVEEFEDLEAGMKALVVGQETDGRPLALIVAAGLPDDLPDRIRVHGQITAVNPDGNTFSMLTRDEQRLTFVVGERTHYRGEGIEGLEDLEPGMGALVVGFETADGGLFALLVAAGDPDDRPAGIRAAGEITHVNVGRGTLTLQPRQGEEITFQTGERTRFKSRDGSIQELGDLEVGMFAAVGGIEQEDGPPLALIVAAGHPEDRPDRPHVDVRAAGRIVGVGNASFTIEKADGGRMTFGVNENTKFKSRDGSVQGLGDLEVGMFAAVGAAENDGGGLTALWVAAGHPPDDRPRPNQRPDSRPARPDQPGRGEGEDI